MKYRVPQFIEIEDKIFGPLTLRQFLYLAGGVGACVAMLVLLPLYVALLLSIVVLGFAGSLAFLEVNNRPFIYTVESFLKYIIQPKLYVWKRKKKKEKKKLQDMDTDEARETLGLTDTSPEVSSSNLEKMAWGLDVKDNVQADKKEGRKKVTKMQSLAGNNQSKEENKEEMQAEREGEKKRFEQQENAAKKKVEMDKAGSDEDSQKDSLNLEV